MRLLLKYLSFGILSFISWNYLGILFIPAISLFLSIIIQSLKRKWYIFLIRVFLLVLIFNISVTFWLMNVTWWESTLAFFGNSIVMTIPVFMTYLIVRYFKYYFFVTFLTLWTLYEILHTQWDLAWSWLTFGHVMGNMHYLVQWYSFTGVYSGTIWIILLAWLLNITFKSNSFNKKYFTLFSVLMFIPILLSLRLYFMPQPNYANIKNITTYIPSEKNNTNYQKTKRLYIDLENYNTENLIVCPEVFLNPVNIYSTFQQKHFFYLDKLLAKKINTTLVFGTELKSNLKLFNSVFIKNSQESLYRIKQKFVPIREFTPQLFQNTLNVQTYYSKNIFDHTEKIKSSFGFLPLVCYESIFSIFTAKKAFNSNFIILATSEDFMNDSYFGKKQYLNIVKLRAIENGRYILKCSNQGISCVINQKGHIVKTITKRIENNEIHVLKKDTFYQKLLSFL